MFVSPSLQTPAPWATRWTFLLVLSGCLSACSPTYDWREVSGPAGLRAQLPCKPDQAERDLPLQGRSLKVQMMGCVADGTTFALAAIEVGVSPSAQEAAGLWLSASLQTAKAQEQSRAPQVPAGAGFGEHVRALGRTPDGHPAHSRAIYFGRGAFVYQAIALGPRLDTSAVDQFLASVALK